MKNLFAAVGAVAVLAVFAVATYLFSGAYNVAADDPHWTVTLRLLERVRDRSVERQARELSVPADLQDQQRVLKGAGQYAAMCASCHLAPGLRPNELARGLYPAPPELAKSRVDPARAFTTIKHGIKMTGMPAWGGPHGDAQIWNLVAFLTRLPELTAQQYQEMLRSPAAGAAAAMASHGAMMQSPTGSGMPMHGEAGHHQAQER